MTMYLTKGPQVPIHGATLLPATVANNNVVPCMAQCCAVACCQKMLPVNRESLYFLATVAVKIKETDSFTTSPWLHTPVYARTHYLVIKALADLDTCGQ